MLPALALGSPALLASHLGRTDHLGAEDQVGDLIAHTRHHFLEIGVPFLLVQHARIALGEGV